MNTNTYPLTAMSYSGPGRMNCDLPQRVPLFQKATDNFNQKYHVGKMTLVSINKGTIELVYTVNAVLNRPSSVLALWSRELLNVAPQLSSFVVDGRFLRIA